MKKTPDIDVSLAGTFTGWSVCLVWHLIGVGSNGAL